LTPELAPRVAIKHEDSELAFFYAEHGLGVDTATDDDPASR
jgi:hypothetical protein